MLSSGEALAPDLVAAFYQTFTGTRLHNLYGPTECAVDVSYWPCPPSPVAPALVPIGRPVANTQLYVLEANGLPAPIGVPGELYIGGVQVGLGYHNRPELTRDRFVPDPFAAHGTMYRTGDRARWRANGTVEYLGRLDHQVKVRGFRIELGEIEATLATHPAVRDVVVQPFTNAGGDTKLIGYYVPATDVTRGDLRAWVTARLPEFMVPAMFVELGVLPLTPNGKVDRQALPVPTDVGDAEAALIAPRTEVEAVVVGVWTEVLGTHRIGVETNFVEVGGHSLNATRIVARMAKIFRTTIPLRRFFDAPTVAGVARTLVELETKPGQAELVARLYQRAKQMSSDERAQLRAAKKQVSQSRTTDEG